MPPTKLQPDKVSLQQVEPGDFDALVEMLAEMAGLAAIARKRGGYRSVWHVPADDHALQRFYRNLGARDVEEGTMILDAQALAKLAHSAAGLTPKQP